MRRPAVFRHYSRRDVRARRTLMLGVAIFIALAVAFGLGVLLNRWVRPYAKTEVEGVKLETLIGPLLTLTVLMLAFVLVQTFAGYKAAKDGAALEAGRIVAQFDLAGFYDDDIALPLQQALLCYGRAVVSLEFPYLSENTTPEPTVSSWGRMMDVPMAQIGRVNAAQPYGTLLGIDKERQDGRRLRIVGARNSVPAEMQYLLLGLSILGVFAIATFTLPNVNRRVQAGVLVCVAVALGAVQLTIVDLDGKYSGSIQVPTADFEIVETLMSDRYMERFPDEPLPCGADGVPLAEV